VNSVLAEFYQHTNCNFINTRTYRTLDTLSNKVLYCRLVELLAQYNLVMEFVPPDGHCLFHTFSFLESSQTMMEWREVLCNRIQQKADTCNNHQSWVSRANNLQPESRQCYADFNSWIMAMRQFEWGNSDFITEFCCELPFSVLGTYL
jgi:hypothetical protein